MCPLRFSNFPFLFFFFFFLVDLSLSRIYILSYYHCCTLNSCFITALLDSHPLYHTPPGRQQTNRFFVSYQTSPLFQRLLNHHNHPLPCHTATRQKSTPFCYRSAPSIGHIQTIYTTASRILGSVWEGYIYGFDSTSLHYQAFAHCVRHQFGNPGQGIWGLPEDR